MRREKLSVVLHLSERLFFFFLQEDRECRIQFCPEVGQMVWSIVSVHRIGGMINTGNTGPLPRLAELRLAHRR